MSLAGSRLFWFQLVNAVDGQPFRGTTATSVSLPAGSVVDQFRDAVKAKHSNKLSSVDAADLRVYKNRAAFDARNEEEKSLMDEDASLAELGKSKNEALIVAIPTVEFLATVMLAEIKEKVISIDERLRKPPRSQVALSAVSSARAYAALTHIGLGGALQLKKYDEPELSAEEQISGFNWNEDLAEDEPNQRAMYMDYLKRHLGSRLPPSIHLVDVANDKTFLNLADSRFPFDIVGGTDVLITEASDVDIMISGAYLLLELKKSVDPNKNWSQAVLELLCADAKTDEHHPVIVVLTDLNRIWQFYWLSESKKIAYFTLKEPKNAFDLIVRVLANTTRKRGRNNDELPQEVETPFKQLKLDQVKPFIADSEGLSDMYENLELLKSDFHPNQAEFRDICRQQNDIIIRAATQHPIFHSMYS